MSQVTVRTSIRRWLGVQVRDAIERIKPCWFVGHEFHALGDGVYCHRCGDLREVPIEVMAALMREGLYKSPLDRAVI